MAAVILSVTVPSPARADAESEAQTLFAAGRQARESQDCEGAIVHFARALEVYPQGLGSLRNIAECQEQLGLFASARRSYWDLRRAALRTAEAKYEGWADWAGQAHARLDARVSRLTLRVAGDAGSRDLKITIDGKPLDPRLIGVALERDPGPTEIALDYGGATPLVRRVALVEGAREIITLDLPAPPREQPPAAGAQEGGSDAMQVAGVVSLAVAGASLIATFVSVGIRQDALASLEEACPAYETEGCPSSVEDLVSRGETASTLINVFGILAGVGAGLGVTLLVLGSEGGPSAAAAPPSGALLSIRGSF